MTRVRHLEDAEAVAAALRDVPLDPILDTVLLTVLDRALKDPAAFPERHWWIAEGDTGMVGVAFRTPPWPLGLALSPGPWVDDLVSALLADGMDIGEVQGEPSRTAAFIAASTKHVGGTWSTVMGQRLLRCDRLRPPTGVPGRSRVVAPDERSQLVAWLQAFGVELDLLREDNEALADGLLGGLARWWVNDRDEPVSVAAYKHPQRGVSRVGPVYTPPDQRRNGYAAAISAHVTQAAYDAGAEQVVLYTDAANPTSNAVYERIGYAFHSEAVICRRND
jgi:GNAT superfamily N-acetyltransferase